MTQFAYPASLLPDEEGGYVVLFRDFPEAITQGDSVEECLSEASDCLEEAIAARIDNSLEIPTPSDIQDLEYRVPVPLQMALKAALYLAIRESGLPATDVRGLLGKDEEEIRQMLDPQFSTKSLAIERALRALGKQVELHLG